MMASELVELTPWFIFTGVAILGAVAVGISGDL